jgi:glycolate oxidase
MPYKKPDEADLRYFRSVMDPKYVLTGEDINEDYSHDELGGVERFPEVLLRVQSTAEVAAIMKYANEHLIPVTARGSGSGLVGGAVPIEGGIMLDMTLMKRILELDEANLTVTVEPGVLLMDLAAFAESHDYMYPPDPGEKSATLGGNISTNAGGMRAVKYGVTREYVRGLTVVTPAGDVLELGGKIVKNSSGYSLKDLIVGSEGTLAVVTEAILRIIPLPKATVSLLIPFASVDEAMGLVPKLMMRSTNPTAVEYVSRECIEYADKYLEKKFPDSQSPAYLLLTYDGSDEESVMEVCGEVAEYAVENGAVDVFVIDTDERKKVTWGTRSAFLDAIKASTSEMDECDVVVPRSRVADFIKYVGALSKEMSMRLPLFGHAGDGNLHVYLCRDELGEEDFQRVKYETFLKMYDKAREMGGKISGEHGVGYAKKEYLLRELGEEQVELMRRIKLAFDPNNILNPGKVCF